jgi:membrane associated rhomboid family serine protease
VSRIERVYALVIGVIGAIVSVVLWPDPIGAHLGGLVVGAALMMLANDA